ncbi:hypothetical protein ACFQT0_08100 [Hymenobacter humi]|uniref:T9SS type A sorting domain-containing protein n=1 Tax=Hymenobacter humi TaxID=1411620 RepID=A0ABW2U4I0_9BACT
MGRRVRTQSIPTAAGLNKLALNIASLAPGFYVLSWQDTQGKIGTRKFIRQ